MASVRIQASRGWMMQEVQEPSEFAASKQCIDPSANQNRIRARMGLGKKDGNVRSKCDVSRGRAWMRTT